MRRLRKRAESRLLLVDAGAAFVMNAPCPGTVLKDMIVYAYYNPASTAPEFQAKFIRLWSESWRKWGWTPRLLTERMAEEHPAYNARVEDAVKVVLAVRHFNKPGVIVTPNVINFGLRPTRIAPGGVSFFKFCAVLSNETIRIAGRSNFRFKLNYRLDICENYFSSRKSQKPLLCFRDWNPDDVMRALQPPRC